MVLLELEQLDKAADADPQPRMRSAALCVLGESEVAQDICAQTADPRIACMRRMLERLEYVNSDDVLLLKGRAACCIEASDELLLVEVIVDGVLNELSTAETVAVLACLLPGQRVAKSSLGTSYSLPLPTAALDRAIAAIKQTNERLKRLAAEFALEPTVGMDERDDLSTELVAAVLAWASGASFEQCWLLSPSTYEGTLVRHLKALDEMLLQLADAASALGNQPLRERFLDGRAAVHRGIAFANSLYLSS
jgi:ATP-dependent RNA helicase DOB1